MEAILHKLVITKVVNVIKKNGFVSRNAKLAIEGIYIICYFYFTLILGIPPICWDKGYAVLHVLNYFKNHSWDQNFLAIYIGMIILY